MNPEANLIPISLQVVFLFEVHKKYNVPMKFLFRLIPIILSVVAGCGGPKKTVFEDKRLKEEESVKFCLLGDLGRDTPQQAEIVKALGREDCHRIFFLGDLVYPKGIKSLEDNDFKTKFLDYYLPLIQNDPDLIINLVLGNHDHKGEPSAWKDVSKAYPQFFFPNYFYLIDYGGLCMVALDTSFYYYTEKVAEAAKQTKWLVQIQSRLKDCDITVAFSHHPMRGGDYPGSKDWNGATYPLKSFLDTYVVGSMDMHVAAHVHILEDDGKDEGTRMLISGTGGEILGGGNPGYVILTWDRRTPKKIGYRIKRIDMDVSISEDPAQLQEEKRPEDIESEYVIPKKRVETPFLLRILNDIFKTN